MGLLVNENIKKGNEGNMVITVRTKVLSLWQFHASHSGEEQITMKEYLDSFKEGQEDIYVHGEFYEQFKEDSMNRTSMAEPPSVHTSNSGDEHVSLKEYVDSMKEGQNDIYITGQIQEHFGRCLGPGLHEEPNRTEMAEPPSIHTSNSGDEQVSLKEYVDCLKEGQNDISITG
ncbi:unnamed protein product, partial [Polarella glacialis]